MDEFCTADLTYNHYAYGAVCQWLFEAVAGFRPDPVEPGFARVIFEPVIVPALSPVSSHHDSAAGRVEVQWRVEGDQVTYEFSVPEDSQGELVLSSRYSEITLNDAVIAPLEDGTARCQVAPGKHKACFRLHWHE